MATKTTRRSTKNTKARATKKAADRPKPGIRKAAPRPPATRKQVLERFGIYEAGGKPVTIIGPDVQAGMEAPEFTAQATDFSEVRGLEATAGKVRLLAPIFSVATPVCDNEMRRFNQEATALGEDVVVMVISADLPVALKGWCATAGVDRVQTLSDHMTMEFGQKYGCWIKERRHHRRAVFVVDRNNRVTYAAYMPKLGDEPNYEEALAAARAAL